jgi:DNA-directed RNA polymerase specialized sigma24 family protein
MQISVEQIEQAACGDPAARDALGAWCLRRAFRLACVDLGSVLNRSEIAEEIAGEASLKAITHLHQFQPGTRFDAWLHQIVRNCIRDHYRRTDRAFPHAVYQRWVHDFLAGYGPDLEVLVQQEFGQDASEPHPVLLARIARDMSRLTYRQLMILRYQDRRAHAVLQKVKGRLRAFVGVHWLPLYDRDDAGEWIETDLPGEDETEKQPHCRRIIRWYYLDQLRVPEIARLENLNERTAYRRLDSCSASFRARLLSGGYFAEFAAR